MTKQERPKKAMGAVRVYVCMGKDCRKRPLSKEVREALSQSATLKVVGCQKICKPPVVGVDRGDGPRWFKKAQKEKSLTALVSLAAGGRQKKSLEKLEIKKRRGKLR